MKQYKGYMRVTRVLYEILLDVKVDLALCIQNVFGYLCGDIDINR